MSIESLHSNTEGQVESSANKSPEQEKNASVDRLKDRTGDKLSNLDEKQRLTNEIQKGLEEGNMEKVIHSGLLLLIKSIFKGEEIDIPEAIYQGGENPDNKNGKDTVTTSSIQTMTESGEINEEKARSALKLNEKQVHFLKNAFTASKKVQAHYGVPWQVCIAQSILETGWGQSVPNGNYFGIKYTKYSPPSTNPGSKTHATLEYVDGQPMPEKASFERHASLEESFMRYGQFLRNNSRYSEAFTNKDPLSFITAVKKAGYATDIGYVGKIQAIWKSLDKSIV